MKKLICLVSLLFCTNVFAVEDHPTDMKLTPEGIEFNISCSKKHDSGMSVLENKISTAYYSLKNILCENLDSDLCKSSTDARTCQLWPINEFIIEKSNPDYPTLVSMLTAAYSAGSKVHLDFNTSGPNRDLGIVESITVK